MDASLKAYDFVHEEEKLLFVLKEDLVKMQRIGKNNICGFLKNTIKPAIHRLKAETIL